MSVVKTIRSKPMPPAAGQFGLMPPLEIHALRAYRPIGCPSIEQFEARMLFANDSRVPPRAA